MSRFIPAGKSDLESLQKSESAAANKFADEQEEKETLSLYEQMKANYIAKELEYEEKVKAKNQSHKIDERELEFYKKLEQEAEEKEAQRKKELENGLKLFEERKKFTNAILEYAKPQTPGIELFKIPKRKLVNKVKKPEIVRKSTTNIKQEKTLEAVNQELSKPVKDNFLLNHYSSSSDSE